MRKRSWNLCFLATVLLAVLAIKGHAQIADLQKHLQDQYQNKIFVLRGFYSDEFLHYDPTGALMGAPTPGDWTVDGFVLLSDLQIRGQRLEIEAKRLLVVSRNDSFQFYADSQKKRKKADSVRIEVELAAANATDAIDALFASIFLTNRNTLGTLVPDYWNLAYQEGFGTTRSIRFVISLRNYSRFLEWFLAPTRIRILSRSNLLPQKCRMSISIM